MKLSIDDSVTCFESFTSLKFYPNTCNNFLLSCIQNAVFLNSKGQICHGSLLMKCMLLPTQRHFSFFLVCVYFLSWSSWTSIPVKEKCFPSITMVEFHIICLICWYCCSIFQATRVSFTTFSLWFYLLLSYGFYVCFCVSCYFNTWGFVLIHFCSNDFDIQCTYIFSIRSHIHGSSFAVTLVMYIGSTYSSSSVSFPYFLCLFFYFYFLFFVILTFHFIHYCAVAFQWVNFYFLSLHILYILSTCYLCLYVCVHTCVCTYVFTQVFPLWPSSKSMAVHCQY